MKKPSALSQGTSLCSPSSSSESWKANNYRPKWLKSDATNTIIRAECILCILHPGHERSEDTHKLSKQLHQHYTRMYNTQSKDARERCCHAETPHLDVEQFIGSRPLSAAHRPPLLVVCHFRSHHFSLFLKFFIGSSHLITNLVVDRLEKVVPCSLVLLY